METRFISFVVPFERWLKSVLMVVGKSKSVTKDLHDLRKLPDGRKRTVSENQKESLATVLSQSSFYVQNFKLKTSTEEVNSDGGDYGPWLRHNQIAKNMSLPDLTTEHQSALEPLLRITNSARWRDAMKDILCTQYTCGLREVLRFLLSLTNKAVILKTSEPSVEHRIALARLNTPTFFEMDKWRQLMAGLGLIIREPENNTALRHCVVVIPATIRREIFRGFQTLLRALLELGYSFIAWLAKLSAMDGRRLLAATKFSQEDEPLSVDDAEELSITLKSLWHSHSDMLKNLGFAKRRLSSSYILSSSPSSWSSSSSASCAYYYEPTGDFQKMYLIHAVAFGLYGETTEVETETSL